MDIKVDRYHKEDMDLQSVYNNKDMHNDGKGKPNTENKETRYIECDNDYDNDKGDNG